MSLADLLAQKKNQLNKQTTVVKQFNASDNQIDQILKPTPPQAPYQGPQRTALFISTQWSIAEWVSDDVIKVMFLTKEGYDDLVHNYSDKMDSLHVAHFEVFDDLTSGAVELRAMQLHRTFRFTHVVCIAEEQLIRGAKIREMLGITHGQTLSSALDYRDKVRMKEKVSAHGIKVPHYAPVEYGSDIVYFIEKHGYPVVIKPRKGYLSVSTYILKDEQELEDFLNSGLNMTMGFDSAQDLIIESFVDGVMHHVDGFVYNGEVKSIWPACYMNKCSDFANSQYLSSYTLNYKDPLTHRLREFFADVLSALEGPECFPFHGEAWITPDDEIVFCEIASRTGGAGVRHQIRELFNIVTDKTWVQWQCEDTITNETLGNTWTERLPTFTYQVAWLFIYPEVGILVDVPTECPNDNIIEGSWRNFYDKGHNFKSRANCVDAVVSCMITGNSDEEMQKNITDVYEWFLSEVKYEKE
eukprot:TRINITY_DN3159_c0_g1_i1.p1 TRINITY_DN3159_c0_g1~~TRINITY_DN3159_c0_g1_i1.p1  ORF type:complete len:470 (-),score=98.82 TRINITY_DN3159_c0_g1_i1:45-1454(-)